MSVSESLSSEVLTAILLRFGIPVEQQSAPPVVEPVSSGLIHSTWKISVASDEAYILQYVNTAVFKDPEAICNNMWLLKDFVAEKDPDFRLICPLKSVDGCCIVEENGSKYRIFPFVKESMVYTVVPSPEVAASTAQSFGKFTAILSDFDCTNLHVSIPQFHDISLRYQQFEGALAEGNKERISKAEDLVQSLRSHAHLAGEAYYDLMYDPNFRLRVTHHDTKISNVLFDTEDASRALCVIDLDTVMPGYFISDVGGNKQTVDSFLQQFLNSPLHHYSLFILQI